MNETLKKRLLSLAWRAGAAAVVGALAVIIKVVPDLGFPEIVTMLIILIGGEVTKFLNSKYQIGGKLLGKK